MPVDHPDQMERLFLRFISGFTAENIRDAIGQDIDLAEIVVEEYSNDVLAEARRMASLYDVTHPGARQRLSNFDDSARRVVEWLKVNKPDLGYEIEAFEAYPTAASLGLAAQGTASVPVALQSEHVGLAWIKKNLRSLAELLL